MESYATIWVCVDCMLHHNNGECGGCHNDYGHDREPLSSIGEEFHLAWDDDEVDIYSTSQCEGCGSWLHGERHAMTLFRNSQPVS